VCSPNADEDGAALRRRGATASQVCSHCLADIRRYGQALEPIALASDQELARAPVEVIQAQRADLTGAQAEPNEQHQHREVPLARARPPIAGRQETLNFGSFERSR